VGAALAFGVRRSRGAEGVTDRRLRAAIALLALAGAAVAAYLVYARYTHTQIACTTGGCETVQHSKYAKAAGIPVAVLGLAAYLTILSTTLSSRVEAAAIAAAVALDQGAPAAAAPLWGAGLLVAGALAERALTLPGDGEIEADALVGWLAGLGTLAGVALAAAALVLLAGTASGGTTVVGLAAGAVLAIVPAVLARRRGAEDGRG